MKKILSLFVGLLALAAAIFNGYLLFFKSDETTDTASTTSESNATTTVTEVPASNQADEASASGQYKDGTYTGAVTSTNRGDYQVQVTVAGGQMTDINVLLFPNQDDMSQQINGNALPIYTAEALANQSAEVNQVSGASEAFKGFTGSLQDALNQAS